MQLSGLDLRAAGRAPSALRPHQLALEISSACPQLDNQLSGLRGLDSGKRETVDCSRIHPELRRTQLMVSGQKQLEVVDIPGVGIEVQRGDSTGIAAVDIAAQYADQADLYCRRP